MPDPFVVVAELFVVPGRGDEFQDFEARAARVMERHGGRIERRIAVQPSEDASAPTEIHVITFPDRRAFESYRRDPELSALNGLRARAIRDTMIWHGRDLPPFEPVTTPA